jgi:hypothetical protein
MPLLSGFAGGHQPYAPLRELAPVLGSPRGLRPRLPAVMGGEAVVAP